MTVTRSSTVSTVGNEAGDLDIETPTGLRHVLKIIPDACYQRSTWRGVGLVVRDFVMYGLAMWGLASTNNVLLLVPLWLFAGLSVAALFVLGHDTAHDALFDSSRLNAVVARITMVPSWHATELWIYGHNRVHHGHTLKQGLDFVWHPMTVEQYRELSSSGRLMHRLEWSLFGAGAYYTRHVWFNKMVRYKPAPRWRKAMRRDQVIVAVPVFGAMALMIVLGGVGGGLWLWVKLALIPFLLFNQIIGWVVYVHHIAPEIRWWPRRDWNRFKGQVEGTTVLWGPPGWDIFFHSIMVHLPHHVDMKIPCYRLAEAAKAIAAAYPNSVDERPIRLRDYRRSVRRCKLYDFEAGTWLPYPAAEVG